MLERIRFVTIYDVKHAVVVKHKRSVVIFFVGTFGGYSCLIGNFYINLHKRVFVSGIKNFNTALSNSADYIPCFDNELKEVIVLSLLESLLLEKDKVGFSKIKYPDILSSKKYVCIESINSKGNIIINKAGGFFHFYIEVLPILLKHKGQNYNIWFPVEDNHFYYSVLKFYNIKSVDSVLDTSAIYENIPLHRYYPNPHEVLSLKRFNNKLFVEEKGPKRIYITRKMERARRILNEDILYQYLADLGFEFVDPGFLDFADQVRYFKYAEWIVAPHGAALSNIVWCNKRVKILELNGDQDVRWHFCKMGYFLNLNYTLLLGKTINNIYFEVNMQALQHVFELVNNVDVISEN
jgi:hypothetical protein